MKRKLLFLLISLVWVCSFSDIVNANTSNPTVFLDGKKLEFDVPPTIIDGSTLVPLRKIFESLGATVGWDDSTQTVTAVKKTTTIQYTVGHDFYYQNNEVKTIPVAGQIVNGSTLVPLRFVGEALGTTVGWEGNTRTITISSAVKKEITVKSVTDGDTITATIDGKEEKIRFIGVDTPETVHPTKAVQQYGLEASNFTKTQLTDKKVILEFDTSERDQYGRILGYIYLEDGTFFNAKLVAEGYAKVATFPPNVRWVELFKTLQTDADNSDRGLWNIDSVVETTPAPVTSTDSSHHLQITEVDKQKEIVTLHNPGKEDVNMTGWKLVSIAGDQSYTFPDGYILKSGDTIQILSGPDAVESSGTLVWTKKNIWNNTESDPAILYNASGGIDFEYKD
jgi:endonuclease YncB( thermonuclease family)